MRFPIHALIAMLAVVLLTHCKDSREWAPYDCTEERLKFEERFNAEVLKKLEQRKGELEETLAGELTDAKREELEKERERLDRRLERPAFFERLDESELPADLEWTTNLEDPDLGSPEAKKGGTLHTYFTAYPRSIRSVGSESNNSFRSAHWDDNEMGLISIHPNTRNVIPALADRWAVGEDGQSVYFHIDERARWSDGKDVTSEDFLMSIYIYLSPYLTPTFYRNYYGEQYWGISSYGPDYVCIRNAFPKPIAPFFASLNPSQVDFYREFGPDFEARYNWRTRPTTGAYEIKPEDVQKGRSITLTRDSDWWARDLKYYKNRFNPDRIEYRLIRDPEKAFQVFLQGDLDFELLGDPKKWYEESEVDSVFKGYIERATFYNVYPRTSRGLYFNMSIEPLDDLNVRIGLQHATNWEKVIDLDLRGDAERLSLLNDGFAGISDTSLKTRSYSVVKAREFFAKAGYDTAGKDGILRNSEGERLSFELSYPKIAALESMVLRLTEEAKRAGVEFRLNGMDSSASFQLVLQKKHEISFMGWGVGQPMIPDFYQQFHSKEAYEDDGKTLRTMTNNISVYADPEVDPILEKNRNATSMDVVIETSRQLERIFHEEAVWVPAYKRSYYRVGYWRWVRWPDDFNVQMGDLPDMSHVLWIDLDAKEETLEAKRRGESFPEVNRVFDQFRTGNDDEGASESDAPDAVESENALEPAEQVGPELLEKLEPEGGE
ncbi:extracellular solute-binding protein [Haloferula chungangensis]|uniref:Extracellular solute-binding protein n=1 Tax=Haloferula chungangensis TaxID=1048331 RepID=A0ABW2L763_9BACT